MKDNKIPLCCRDWYPIYKAYQRKFYNTSQLRMQKENWTISNNYTTVGNYTFNNQDLQGQGTTGKVYRGQHSSSGNPVAIKHISSSTLHDQATRTLLNNEIKALKMVSHPNVLQFQDVVQTNGDFYIVTQLIQGKTLKEQISHRGHFTEAEAMTLFRDILAGCRAITDAGIIHRDLKPGNIMLAGKTPKIIDFGFCEVIMGGGIVRAFNVGSPAYMAPEALFKTLFSEKSDSWSLGVILYEMLHGDTVDRGMDIRAFLERIQSNPNLIRESLSDNLSQNVREILLKSLLYKPEERMSISGMKYLTDVYMVQQKKKKQSEGSTVNQIPLACQSWKNNQTHNIPGFRSSAIEVNPDNKKLKEQMSIAQVYSKAKENQVYSRQSSSQFLGPPKKTVQRWQPLTDNVQSQPSGFISYSQFTRDSMNGREIRESNMIHGSLKMEKKDNSMIMGSWKKATWVEGMERPHGQPVFRQIRVRYL